MKIYHIQIINTIIAALFVIGYFIKGDLAAANGWLSATLGWGTAAMYRTSKANS